MQINPYQSVRDFESRIADFTGATYAVAVDSCSSALFLACRYLNVQEVTIPCRTYPSVPCSIIHAGGTVNFVDEAWEGMYQLRPYPVYDSACQLNRGMYMPGTYQCVSFSSNKAIPIGKGGMILHDDPDAQKWFKLARYEGRSEVPLMEDTFDMLGWNMYMTPEQGARGLLLVQHIQDENIKRNVEYPDLSKFDVYRNGNRNR